jgi:hypothetical protein
MQTALRHVRSQVQSGKHLLPASTRARDTRVRGKIAVTGTAHNRKAAMYCGQTTVSK